MLTGWIAVAGSQPAARSASPTAPSASGPAPCSISGSILRWLARTPSPSPSRASVVKARTSASSQTSRTGPRGAYAKAQGSGPGRRSSTWAPIPATGSWRRLEVQPLTAFTRAQAESWRYEPSLLASTMASQAAGAGSARGAIAAPSRAVTRAPAGE